MINAQKKRRGEHIHHGYWPASDPPSTDSKETAQLNLIHLLLSTAALSPDPAATTTAPLRILDVGCGVGGTTRYVSHPSSSPPIPGHCLGSGQLAWRGIKRCVRRR